jgi:hypothetical protein
MLVDFRSYQDAGEATSARYLAGKTTVDDRALNWQVLA